MCVVEFCAHDFVLVCNGVFFYMHFFVCSTVDWIHCRDFFAYSKSVHRTHDEKSVQRVIVLSRWRPDTSAFRTVI